MEKEFNPDINSGRGVFGLPFQSENSLVHIIPVPWDLTASYGKGSSKGPRAIYNASFQLDLFRDFFPEYWKSGIYMPEVSEEIGQLNLNNYPEIQDIVAAYNDFKQEDEIIQSKIHAVNDACFKMNRYVYEQTIECISNRKLPVVLGGDHSSPLGLVTALSETNEQFGVLQLDAHADLRKNYQGFSFSHASIMYNILKLQAISVLVQVGIRDYCTEEDKRIRNSQGRIQCFSDRYIQHQFFEGSTWQEICSEIINELPSKVYISFDIDSLSPEFCPNTGTPVPGGLTPAQISYLMEGICLSGRRIIGADLCEVSPSKANDNEWDANVGARALLDLCMYMIYSNSR